MVGQTLGERVGRFACPQQDVVGAAAEDVGEQLARVVLRFANAGRR